MNLITDNWRLKLLAVGLAVLMLGAVDFSQNPPRSRTLTVGLSYSVASGLILINPPSKIDVTISGLADVIAAVTADNITATADATKASPGPAVKLNVSVKSLILGVTVQNPAPIAVNIDVRQTVPVPVTVAARAAPGWTIDKAVAVCSSNPCTINFDGPATWEIDLTATVVYPSPVNFNTIDSANYPIQLHNSLGLLDLSAIRTIAPASIDVIGVPIHIEAHSGSSSSTVALVDSPPSQPPPVGYRVTAIAISPITVLITGDVATISRIQRIVLPAIDLSGHTSDFTIQVTIKYPDGVTGSTVTAKITYSISANPNVTPSP